MGKAIITLVGMAAGCALALTAARAEAAADAKRAKETSTKRPAQDAGPAAPDLEATPASRTPVLPAAENPRLEPGPGPAAPPSAPGFPGDGYGLLVEPRVGGFLPSGRLGLAPSFGVQAGRILVPEKQLWAIVELGFARPTHDGRGGTAEAPLGTFRYDLAVDDFSILLGSRMMFPMRIEKLERLTPFAEAGLKLHVLHSTSSGRSDSLGSFGRSSETSLAPGLALRGGAAYRLGPGAVSAALELAYARVGQRVTGDVWFGGLGFQAGYLYAF